MIKLTQQDIETDEIEFTTTRKLADVGGVERFRTSLGGRTKQCSYCLLLQKKVEFRHHCIACGQPYAIKNKTQIQK